VRSDLIETFKIMTFSLIKMVEENMIRNCSREDSDLILESTLFVTKLLITGTHYSQVTLTVILLTRLRSISCLNWNGELYGFYSYSFETVGSIR